jgi:hypothetical protein
MTKSDSIKELCAALAKAQPQIEGASKDKNNPAFKSKYADLASVSEAIAAPLAAHGLSYIQVSHDRENAAAIETIILHASGEWLSAGIVAVPVTKHDAHGFGSALTYARRYSLSAAFGVVPEDDDGNAAAKSAPAKSVITPASGMFEQQTVDMQNHLLDIGHRVSSLFKKGDVAGAWDEWSSAVHELDEIQRAAAWSKLESQVRSGLKRESDSRKEKAAA